MKIIRTSTIPKSINVFCRGLLKDLEETEGYEIVVISSPDDDLKEIEEREKVRTIPIKMERRMSPFKDLISLVRLIKVLHREKPDMIHSITPKAGLLSMVAGWICRVPVRMHTFTGLVFPTATGITQKILILTDKITCACATHINPEGEGVKSDLIKYKITKKELKIIGNGNVRGIDLDYYDRNRSDIKAKITEIKQPEIFTFIFVGRLVRDKGINELIKAFEVINNENPKTRLLLVGPEENDIDPLEPETLEIIKNNNAIKAVGHQNDVRPWLAASDALVFPSYREGFPNVVIEAGALGIPSIVTDINGSREIIIDGKNGVIIPSKDISALISAMRTFINDRAFTQTLAENARGLIASRYDQRYVRKCLKSYYYEVLTSK